MSILMAFTARWYIDLRQDLPAQIYRGPEKSHICGFIIWEHSHRLYLNHLCVHTTDSSLEYILGSSLGTLLQSSHCVLFKEKKKEIPVKYIQAHTEMTKHHSPYICLLI